MKKNIKKLIIVVAIVIILIIGIGDITFKQFGETHYIEWVSIMVTLCGAIIGGSFTMIGVVATLKNEELHKEIERKNQIKRLAIIINSEFEEYLKSASECFNEYIYLLVRECKYGEKEFCEGEGRKKKIYDMSNNLKEVIYDLIGLIGEKEECNDILRFYLLYLQHKEEEKEKEKEFVLGLVFHSKYIQFTEIENNRFEDEIDEYGEGIDCRYKGIDRVLLPKLEDSLINDRILELGSRFKKAKKFLSEATGHKSSQN